MAKDDVMRLFETDLTDPGSSAADSLFQHVLMHSERVIDDDRQGLLDALTEWLGMRTSTETILAVEVAKELKLVELRDPIKQLRDEVAAGNLFLPYYLEIFDNALAALEPQ